MLRDIENTNSKFYDAFENTSIDFMENIWSHKEDCICIHPGWQMFVGWLAIHESWVTIFENIENIKFIITNTKIRIYDNAISVVTCLENIETIENYKRIKTGVVATNIFEYDKKKNKWLMIHHQGSSVLNYFPPTT